MDPKLTKIFCDFQVEPRPHLCADICHVIVLREKRSRQIKFFGYTIIAITSFAIIIPTGMSLAHTFGFGNYSIVLIESLPVLGAASMIVSIFFLGWSTRNVVRQARRTFFIQRTLVQ